MGDDKDRASADAKPEESHRRGFLSKISSLTMAGGLLAGYGALTAMAMRFLYPSQERKLAWIFVGQADRIQVNEVLRLRTPAGQTVNVTRRKQDGTVDDFLALSTTCPHLGCQVHWEPQHERFFCPCHNGAFDPTGKPTEGPPASAGQSLPQFPLRLENGLLFLQAPAETLG